MLARRVLNIASLRKVASTNVKFGLGARAFSDEPLTIPTDKDQQGGRRREELDAAEKGEIAFDHRKSLVPPNDQGTKENPIMVRIIIDDIFSLSFIVGSAILVNNKLTCALPV